MLIIVAAELRAGTCSSKCHREVTEMEAVHLSVLVACVMLFGHRSAASSRRGWISLAVSASLCAALPSGDSSVFLLAFPIALLQLLSTQVNEDTPKFYRERRHDVELLAVPAQQPHRTTGDSSRGAIALTVLNIHTLKSSEQ